MLAKRALILAIAAAYPTLDLDFTTGVADPRLTISGGANGTRINSAGVLVAANAPRFDYNPSTLSALGLLVEEQRTNSIRNNTATGAVTGTPGTAPTNWGIPTPWDGLARQIVGTGVETGIAYLDVRFSGTISAGGVAVALPFDTSTAQSAAAAQTWTQTVYLRLVAGSFANVASLTINPRDYDSTPTLVESLQGANLTGTITGAALIGQRYTFSTVLTGATIASVQANLRLLSGTAGQAVDFTLRIGLPQLELAAFADSAVQTSSAAVARTADSALLTGANFSSWFNGTTGTFVVQFDVNSVTAGTRPILSLDDNSANQQIRLYASGTSVKLTVTNGGVTQADLTLGTITAGSANKVAFAYAAADFAAVLNGGTVQTAASGTVPTVDRARLGSDQAGNVLNGHDRSLRFFPNRQPNASLASLSS